MSKMMNPTRVITGKNTRWSYCNAWEAKAINQKFTPRKYRKDPDKENHGE